MTALHEYERYAGVTDPPWHARLAADYAEKLVERRNAL